MAISRRAWIVVVVLVALNATVLVWNLRRSAAGARADRATALATLRAVVQLPPDTTLVLGRGPTVAFSPDGRRIVYAAQSKGREELYVRSLDRFESTPIPGTEDGTEPFFSPDGQWVGFFAHDKMKKVRIDGSAAPSVLADAAAPRGNAWGPDNTIFVTPRDNTGLWRYTERAGKLEPVTTLGDGEASHRWPQVLPDNTGVLYTVWSGGWDTAQVVVQPHEGGARKTVVKGGGCARFVPGDTAGRGYLVYARNDGLAAVPFDLSRLATTGDAIPIAGGVIMNLSGAAHFAVSANGSLAYVSGAGSAAERPLVWVNRSGAETPAITLRGMSRSFNLSPDGTRLLHYNADGPATVVRADALSNGTAPQIIVPSDPITSPWLSETDRLSAVWSADAREVAYSAGTPLNLFRAATDGGGAERLTTSANLQWPTSWSADGTKIAFVELDPLSSGDIWVLTLDAARQPQGAVPFLRTPFSESAPAISPNGKWIAYHSNESGRYEVYVQPFPEGGKKQQISTDHGVYPRWSRSGDELFFRSGPTREGMAAVSVTWDPAFHPGTPRTLFDARRYESLFDVSPDGTRFLMMPLMAPGATQMNLVVNWVGELRQRSTARP